MLQLIVSVQCCTHNVMVRERDWFNSYLLHWDRGNDKVQSGSKCISRRCYKLLKLMSPKEIQKCGFSGIMLKSPRIFNILKGF